LPDARPAIATTIDPTDVKLGCRLHINAAAGISAVVDVLVVAVAPQGSVDRVRPILTPMQKLRLSVPFALLGAEHLVHQLLGGQQDVGVQILWVVTVDTDVGDHVGVDKFGLRVLAQRLQLLGFRCRCTSRHSDAFPW
jgi:hypothetical protein